MDRTPADAPHFLMCTFCRRCLKQMDLTKSRLGRLGKTPARPEIPASLRKAFKNRKAE